MQRIFIFITIVFISCGETGTTNVTSNNSAQSIADTMQNKAVLTFLFDKSKVCLFTRQSDIEFAFHKNYKVDTLNYAELQLIEKKLLHSIDSFNVEGKKRMDKRQRELGPSAKIDRNYFVIDTSRYKFQIVPGINDKNEKEVWINAFCKDNDRNWRTEIITTKDGGICYFNSTINLTTKQILYFMVNDDI
jgi:hypothetical protein